MIRLKNSRQAARKRKRFLKREAGDTVNTKLFKITEPESQQKEVEEAAAIIKAGGLVAIPTETVYGLGANALNPEAVKRIFEAKGRPQDNPLIIHVVDAQQTENYAKDIPAEYYELCRRFSPGPLTVILKKKDCIPMETSGGLDTVAVRIPSHPVARAIIAAAGVPVAAPSANLSGKPSPTSAQHCVDDLWGRVEAIVDSGDCSVGLESTVISLAEEVPVLLRPGAVTAEELREVLPDLQIHQAVTSELQQGAKATSPGMRYKHYSPNAKVTILNGSSSAYTKYILDNRADGVYALCFEEDAAALREQNISCIVWGSQQDEGSQAQHLFAALRELDKLGAKKVYAHGPSREGVGLAVYNRLIRAAGFDEADLDED